MLIPLTCSLCGEVGPGLCPACRSELSPPIVEVPNGLVGLSALFSYEGEGKRLVQAFKFSNRRGAIRPLAVDLADRLKQDADLTSALDLVTWVPSSKQGLRQRGYDTARLLAKSVGGQLHLPCRHSLRRLGSGGQTECSIEERLLGPLLLPTRPVKGNVLLVDDVCTTGTSLSVAADVLLNAGAISVYGAVVASTPLASTR